MNRPSFVQSCDFRVKIKSWTASHATFPFFFYPSADHIVW